MKQSDLTARPPGPLISVVIPTFKRSERLSQCLKALHRQTFSREHYELIVVQDGHNSITEKKIKRYFPDVRYYSLNENKGPAAARNYGWLSAKGKLIAFTDDDCIPDKNWLKDIWAGYDNEPEIAYTGRVVVPLSESPTHFELESARRAETGFITANCICSKSALLKIGGFDERFRMSWQEDHDLEFKLLSEEIPVKRLDNALVTQPVRKAAWGISIREQKMGMFNVLLYKKFPFLYRQKIGEAPSYSNYLMIILLFGMTYGLITSKPFTVEITISVYILLILCLTFKRLRNTSRNFSHIVEMLLTSMIIPFVFVYWQLYGAFKYRVLI